MQDKEINLIRNAALKLEDTELKMAHDLMELAHKARPEGPFIKKKLLEYKAALAANNVTESDLAFRKLVSDGDVAVIPIGFRCYTTRMIKKKLGIEQASLPFDSGFFSPYSVASVLKTPLINMSFEGEGKDHSVCMKNENHEDPLHGTGVKFQSSSYTELNSCLSGKTTPELNKYLDSTCGYYTLNRQHMFVLAHYNWHPLADESKSHGIVNPQENLISINNMLNRRIDRMMEMIKRAKHVFFIFGNSQGYQNMQIDEHYFKLHDFDELQAVCEEKFGDKFTIIKNIAYTPFTTEDALSCLSV